MPVTTGGLSSLLAVDFKRTFYETGKQRPTEYTEFLNITDMSHQNEKDLQISGLGALPPKPEGVQFTVDEPILGGNKTYTASPHGMAVEITYELWRTDQSGVMPELIRSLSRASQNKLEVSGHKVLNNAFSTSFTGFTSGEALVQTSHAKLDGSTENNTPATSQSFSITYLQGMIQRFHDMTDHRGLPRLMRPTRIIVTPADLFVAREILGSQSKPFSANNEINSLVPEAMMFMVSHYITTSGHHFSLAPQGEHDLNMRFIDRPFFDSFDDPRTKTMVSTVYQFHTDSSFGSWVGIDGSCN